MNNWDNVVSGDELIRAKKARAKTYEDRRISEASLSEFEKQGWELVSIYKNGDAKVRRGKPVGEAFENKVWLLLFNMGFEKMNRDNKFVIPYGSSNEELTQQIDVFATDGETVLVVECKSAKEPGTSGNFKKDIEALNGNREGLIRSIKKEYGDNIQIKFIWATTNLVLGKDIKRLADANIIHFNDEAIDYYAGLAAHLGKSARYQFLGKIFAQKDIGNMPSTVPAIRGKMGGYTYYSFSIEPERLLKIGYVLHRSDANNDMLPTYQRVIKKDRLKSVREFVGRGGYFPNSVIVSVDTSKKGLRFDLKSGDTDSDTKLGILHLPQKYCSAYIIDGQHRLYGYSETEFSEKCTIPVVAFENLDKRDQLRLFMEINENQKAVPRNLRNTLNADLLWESENYNDRRRALRLRIAQDLGEKQESPLYDRVLIGENTSTMIRCITMEMIENGLDSNFFTRFSENICVTQGTFDHAEADNNYAYKLLFPFLVQSLCYFKENLPDEWNLGKDAEGILTNNTGIYALLRFFSDSIDFLLEHEMINPKEASKEDLVSSCAILYSSIVTFYQNIDPALRTEIKKRRGRDAIKHHWRHLQKAASDEIGDFNPPGLEDWWADNSKEHNESSAIMLEAILNRTKNLTMSGLESLHGTSWENKGIPYAIVGKYASEMAIENIQREENGQDKLSTWDLVSLEDCADIVKHGSNWSEHYKGILARSNTAGRKGNKNTDTKWIIDMHKLLNKLKKPGTSISRSEYEYISSIHQWLVGDRTS